MSTISGYFLGTPYQRAKNDHVFHNTCLMHLIQFYDKERDHIGEPKIDYNVDHTDNCLTQYKCSQNFYQILTSADTNSLCQIHKFAKKSGSKEAGTPLASS